MKTGLVEVQEGFRRTHKSLRLYFTSQLTPTPHSPHFALHPPAH